MGGRRSLINLVELSLGLHTNSHIMYAKRNTTKIAEISCRHSEKVNWIEAILSHSDVWFKCFCNLFSFIMHLYTYYTMHVNNLLIVVLQHKLNIVALSEEFPQPVAPSMGTSARMNRNMVKFFWFNNSQCGHSIL